MRALQLAHIGGWQLVGLKGGLVAVKHAVAHILGVNQGYVESYWINDRLWMIHVCKCGKETKMFEWMDEEEYHTGI
jgi:hypothetical protein